MVTAPKAWSNSPLGMAPPIKFEFSELMRLFLLPDYNVYNDKPDRLMTLLCIAGYAATRGVATPEMIEELRKVVQSDSTVPVPISTFSAMLCMVLDPDEDNVDFAKATEMLACLANVRLEAVYTALEGIRSRPGYGT